MSEQQRVPASRSGRYIVFVSFLSHLRGRGAVRCGRLNVDSLAGQQQRVRIFAFGGERGAALACPERRRRPDAAVAAYRGAEAPVARTTTCETSRRFSAPGLGRYDSRSGQIAVGSVASPKDSVAFVPYSFAAPSCGFSAPPSLCFGWRIVRGRRQEEGAEGRNSVCFHKGFSLVVRRRPQDDARQVTEFLPDGKIWRAFLRTPGRLVGSPIFRILV